MANNDGDAMATDSSQPQQPPQLAELIQSLERATSVAKQLSLSSTDNNRNNIFAYLTSAQLSLSSFISLHSSTTTATGPDNSASFADDEPMIAADDGGKCGGDDQDDDDDEEEMNSKDLSMEKVEEKMRELFNVKCKRLKRPVSPSSVVAEERRRCEERDNGRVVEVFDPIGTKLRNFDLIFQFHA